MDCNTIATNSFSALSRGTTGAPAAGQIQLESWGEGATEIVCGGPADGVITLPGFPASDNTILPIDPGQDNMMADILKFFISMLTKLLASLEGNNPAKPRAQEQGQEPAGLSAPADLNSWSNYDQAQ